MRRDLPGGKLVKRPGLRRANRRAGTKTFGPVISNITIMVYILSDPVIKLNINDILLNDWNT